MANNIDLTICALECPLGTFQCSGRLIFRFRTDPPSVRRCSAGLIGSAKRSGFSRFAASIRAHCAFSSKTLMLQVRFAHPPNCAPLSRFFVLFSKTHDLQIRFAHPPSPHRNLLSEGSGVPHGLFCNSAPSPIRALVFRSAYSASRNARASAAFAASIEAHRAVSSETLMLQVRFAHPPNPAPLSRFFSISRRSGLMAPLCKGSCPASSRTEGLPPD